MMLRESVSILLVGAVLGLSACGKSKVTDQGEVAQAAGDVMSAADESTGSSGGGFAFLNAREPEALARLNTTALDKVTDYLLPEAHAASCFLESFSACVAGVKTRTFAACSLGNSTLTGTVSVTFSGGGCTWADGVSVTRKPDFTLTGRRGGTLTVSGDGQRLTRVSQGNFTYEVLGMSRVLRDALGATVADVTTKTTTAITVTGTSRADRVMNGGSLEIKNNTKGYTATLTPTNLTWASTCNCAVSGTLTGSIEGQEEADEVTIEVTGCGTAKMTSNGESEDLTFDRCASTS